VTENKLDTFTRAYIEAALWSSTVEPFGVCARCDKEKPLGDHGECFECAPDDNNSTPPADENYSVDDLAPETQARMVADCEKFQAEHPDAIDETNLVNQDSQYNASERAGHDFWLNRNGHGAGFWDGDWKEPAASELDAASKAFGSIDLYVGDDGRLYLS
jgi:hypothetical protein